MLALNRTPGKAGRLASDLGCAWAALDAGGLARMKDYSDVSVQTTSAGRHPQEDGNPAAGYTFTGRELAYDLVYSPPDTPFLTAARLKGCRTLGGLDMLLEQAYCQFRVFTGRDYPETAKLEIRGLLREQITGG
ncbi:MAG: hypothetical protein E4H36_11250 [Spirochaetales bacterium]|nr:MAG: hypothetical protein E4H36_11250 [Spirochaetales bacterium]